jgi:DNA modification methylase
LPIRDGCVDCVVTSPPYWGLRDYGIAGQLGLEATPAAYVAALVAVFREVRRVLKDDGVCWVNLGDSFAGGGSAGSESLAMIGRPLAHDVKPKNLIGIPWRVAFALQADGWYLRADIIWAKPNPMPESVTDRPTKAHEYLFLLTKRERYYYDGEAIAEAATQHDQGTRGATLDHKLPAETNNGRNHSTLKLAERFTRNKRSVWTIPTMPYAGAHFATFPEALVEPCILAGCPLGGLVLDPFLGSGTVGAVAERLSRRWVGTDLAYHDLATERTAQRGFRFEFAEAVS